MDACSVRRYTREVNAGSFLKRNIDSREQAVGESCHPYSCNGDTRNEAKSGEETRKGGGRGDEGAARPSFPRVHHRRHHQNHPPVANRASIQRLTTFLWSTKKASPSVPVSFEVSARRSIFDRSPSTPGHGDEGNRSDENSIGSDTR